MADDDLREQVLAVLNEIGEDPADYDLDGLVAELNGERIDVPGVVSKFWRVMLRRSRIHPPRARHVDDDSP